MPLSSRNIELLFAALVFFALHSAAQETVIRANSKYVIPVCDSCAQVVEIGNFQTDLAQAANRADPCISMGMSCALSRANSTNSFSVYRTEQVDSKVNDLKQQITILQQDIKTLSDANDALTKRLDDAERKLNKLAP